MADSLQNRLNAFPLLVLIPRLIASAESCNPVASMNSSRSRLIKVRRLVRSSLSSRLGNRFGRLRLAFNVSGLISLCCSDMRMSRTACSTTAAANIRFITSLIKSCFRLLHLLNYTLDANP